MAFILAILTLTAMAFSTFALDDIATGAEPDFRLEWSMVRVSYLLNLLFIGFASAILFRLGREKPLD